jgi:exosome complex component RRP41
MMIMAGTGEVKLFREDGKRLDGRNIDELRPLKLEVGILPQADGSAYIEHGNNKIICSVYGPREIRPRHLMHPQKLRIRAEYRLATFSVNERKSPAPRRREHELSKMITEALEPSVFLERFPRATMDMYILVLDADGGTRAASITAASLALADAGLPLRGLVSAVAAGKINDKIVLDLSDIEDKDGEGDLPIAINNQNKEITLCQLDGQFQPEEVKKAIELAMKGCETIYQIQKEVLIKKYAQLRSEITEDEEILEVAVEKAEAIIEHSDDLDSEEQKPIFSDDDISESDSDDFKENDDLDFHDDDLKDID